MGFIYFKLSFIIALYHFSTFFFFFAFKILNSEDQPFLISLPSFNFIFLLTLLAFFFSLFFDLMVIHSCIYTFLKYLATFVQISTGFYFKKADASTCYFPWPSSAETLFNPTCQRQNLSLIEAKLKLTQAHAVNKLQTRT